MQSAAKLAVGYLLDELKNDITRETPASFAPSIDYVVTKIPRFAFDVLAHGHHSASRPHAHHAVKSGGEAMAIGRTFKKRPSSPEINSSPPSNRPIAGVIGPPIRRVSPEMNSSPSSTTRRRFNPNLFMPTMRAAQIAPPWHSRLRVEC